MVGFLSKHDRHTLLETLAYALDAAADAKLNDMEPRSSMSAAPALQSVADVPTAGEESYFTVFAGGEAFGLSVLHAQTIFRITSVTPIPLGPADIVGLVNLRGRIVTAVSLRRRLGIPVRRS